MSAQAARKERPLSLQIMTTLPAALIARLHTILAASAFFTAFFVGCALHYKKIVKNSVAAYPDEWFPSVSAT